MGKLYEADLIRDFSSRKYVHAARVHGDPVFRIVAGDVHREMGLSNRVPNVCNALRSRKFLNENSLILEKREGPPSGQGTTVTYTYRFRNAEANPEKQSEWPFLPMRGIAAQIFKSLGGGERFIRGEREEFNFSTESRDRRR